jgi:hypothetical protein
MNGITAPEFLETVFPEDMLLPDERPVVAHPDSFISPQTGKQVDYYRQLHPSSRTHYAPVAWYFCVSTVERQRKRQVKKRLEDVRTAMVLVLDDIGTKSQQAPVYPSYKLETSKGNFQWGYLIEPFDVSTPDGQQFYDMVLWSMAKAGHNDEGMRSASRLARLPGSLHRTGWVGQVTDWQPQRVWELSDLFTAFDVPEVKPRKARAVQPGKHATLDTVDDPIYHWLVERKLVHGNNDQWVFIECPWRHRHTDGAQGSSSSAYSPKDYGRGGSSFKCLHGHCAHRDLADFLSWIMGQKNAND